MDRSLGFGSTPSDWTPYSDSISLRLPYSVNLATECKSLTHYTKGTQSPHKGGSHCLYACGFRIYFTPLPGFFSPFPHGTGALSVTREYLALENGLPRFPRGFSCPVVLKKRRGRSEAFAHGAITLSGRPFQASFACIRFSDFRSDRQIGDDALATLPQLTLA